MIIINGRPAVRVTSCAAHDGASNDRGVLFTARLPARMDVQQAADFLGFLPHEISLLMRAGLLKPLGNPPHNGHKFFSSGELQALANDRRWLDKATRAVTHFWRQKIKNTGRFFALLKTSDRFRSVETKPKVSWEADAQIFDRTDVGIP